MSAPDISIITPVRNRGPFIEAAVRSVLAQSHPSIEHVIVDGASTDETPAILARAKGVLLDGAVDSGTVRR